ncbi:MAG TPA: hypothetical protein VND64_26290 [Pirellulales bacterium]|nr:hypothetical protein [Pirellulales bacterium]
MSITTFLSVCGTTIVGLVVLALASVGTLFIIVRAWRCFVAWLAQPHVEIERRRSRVRLARMKHVAVEREEAMLRGASVMANELLRTAVESQLQHLAYREEEHRRHDLRMLAEFGIGPAERPPSSAEGERVATSTTARSDVPKSIATLAICGPFRGTRRRTSATKCAS